MDTPSEPAFEAVAVHTEPRRISLRIPRRVGRFFWQGRLLPAFWTVASLFSLTVNVILVVILALAARQLFTLKGLVADKLVGGLHRNFVAMDAAHIRTTIQVQDTIQVNDSIPVVFDLTLAQNTQVALVEDTPVSNAVIYLNGSPVPMDLLLRKGTLLNINLNLTVPVSQTVPVMLNVPVNLSVPVDIPLDETELHEPFVGLQEVVAPYDQLLFDAPSSWHTTPVCAGKFEWLCDWLEPGGPVIKAISAPLETMDTIVWKTFIPAVRK